MDWNGYRRDFSTVRMRMEAWMSKDCGPPLFWLGGKNLPSLGNVTVPLGGSETIGGQGSCTPILRADLDSTHRHGCRGSSHGRNSITVRLYIGDDSWTSDFFLDGASKNEPWSCADSLSGDVDGHVVPWKCFRRNFWCVL